MTLESWTKLYYEMAQDPSCGCEGCAYIDIEDWAMPCSKCRRNAKDYYRYRPNEMEEE